MSEEKGFRNIREELTEIFHAGLEAVKPDRAIESNLQVEGSILKVAGREFNLDAFQNVYVIGAGKASASMAKGLEETLGNRITGGLVNVGHGHILELKKIRLNEAGHPLPDKWGEKGAEEIVEMAKKADRKDLVFCLLSGGGSAFLPLPVEGITLEVKQELTRILLSCGATIGEINTLRKHLSRIKGGQLARYVYPATLITLILSDVVGDDVETIASGPTVPDSTTFADCLTVLHRYGIENKIPKAVHDRLRKGLKGEVPDTPKEGETYFQNNVTVIVGNNLQAVKAAGQRAKALGYRALILSTCVIGETREVARVHAAIAKEIVKTGNPLPPPACLLSGGETSVTIRGKGQGGRNQEFALAAAIEIAGDRRIALLSAATDGIDGPTEAAGAFADAETITRARRLGLDARGYLDCNDSHSFFKRMGDLLITGPTLTNVMDLRIFLII